MKRKHMSKCESLELKTSIKGFVTDPLDIFTGLPFTGHLNQKKLCSGIMKSHTLQEQISHGL